MKCRKDELVQIPEKKRCGIMCSGSNPRAFNTESGMERVEAEEIGENPVKVSFMNLCKCYMFIYKHTKELRLL